MKRLLDVSMDGPKVNLVDPFLEGFQSNAHLASFLYTDLTILISDLMTIFIEKEVRRKGTMFSKLIS